MDAKDIPDARKTLRKYGLSIIPLFVLIAMIVMGYGAMYTALFATSFAIVLSFVNKNTRMSFKTIVSSLIKGCKGVMSIATACAAAGCVIGVISLTGLGLKLSSLIISISGGRLIVVLLLTEVALFVLGMGLPTAPAYMLVAVLVAPALTQLGVPELAAHMFVFYGACLSSITPPVAMAAYTAAGIANASPIKIGMLAVKLAIVTYIAPIFFVYSPELIGIGTPSQIILAFISGVIGCFGLSIGIVGYFKTKLHPLMRVLTIGAGLMCIYPGIWTDSVGYTIIIGIGLVNLIMAKRICLKQLA
ncbi:hypothetical protein SDC9_126909 [bioreactor metagenome]|uniref:TRAP C4-dicarboxylate transport system permease DctM subunit domain-containing protein n=1 Tax=bioreactor metagenome TaxID=1076179 RepID=A0A645CSG7_9ZZZZ